MFWLFHYNWTFPSFFVTNILCKKRDETALAFKEKYHRVYGLFRPVEIIPAAVGHPHIAKNNLYGLFIRIHNEVVFQSHSQVLYSLINFIMI